MGGGPLCSVAPGVHTITVGARDPTTGATASAARRVSATDEGQVVWAVPNADGYCCR